MGFSDGRNRGKGPAARENRNSSLAALDGAETLQQQAERKSGGAAIPGLQQAAAAFKECVRLAKDEPLPAGRLLDAYFGLGESMQRLAECILEACSALPDSQLSAAVEADARSNAKILFRQSVDAYKKVKAEDGRVRVDACVNAANVLAAWADVEEATGDLAAATQLLISSVEGYQRSLEQEEDAATWSNLADTLVKRAELLAADGDAESCVGSVYGEAMAAYAKACSLCSSEDGDDLPGLLHNWGVGLHSLGTHAKNPALAASSLAEAAARLRESCAFNRGDPQPHNALGDVLAAAAEASSDAMEALGCYNAALDEGYSAALRVNGHDPDGLVGTAEVNTALGKLAEQTGNREVAAQRFSEALRAYVIVLQRPEAIGGLRERSDALTCGAIPGHEVAAAQQQIAGTLAGLLSLGTATKEQFAGDADFSGVREQPWFVALVQ
ncbi:hypothetical protein COCSUDRAFT_61299 [Coccomyxa subellipsoidea C-169]|uniref:TPR-like protein n=1 Tax=Coccomyxa subellipsoidea (strain C-169) TaxID=574566 RepID=I0Z334_COCSC|nr:hypothetical protein COCSUDRAFT_61299 [Coccomyxa subellipsoidea C-169]EIE25053.1 hypothetical protein COCSUDRAFT_61299 [Coccomyxa subellipsoidea C-169]|eukprot:XP_005649597.1 hypothetical protein COCSUDRAFT_61299 [Coccomyxa subellipsoidea C-169]